MNWTRTILDGLAMAAYFNLFAAAVALYKPRLMFPLLSDRHHQGGERTADKGRKPFLLALDLLWGVAAPPSLWCGQHCGGRDNRLLAFGPDGIYPVDGRQCL